MAAANIPMPSSRCNNTPYKRAQRAVSEALVLAGKLVGYEKTAEICGGKSYLIHTPKKITEEGFKAKVPAVFNIVIESGKARKPVSHFSLLCSRQVRCGSIC